MYYLSLKEVFYHNKLMNDMIKRLICLKYLFRQYILAWRDTPENENLNILVFRDQRQRVFSILLWDLRSVHI